MCGQRQRRKGEREREGPFDRSRILSLSLSFLFPVSPTVSVSYGERLNAYVFFYFSFRILTAGENGNRTRVSVSLFFSSPFFSFLVRSMRLFCLMITVTHCSEALFKSIKEEEEKTDEKLPIIYQSPSLSFPFNVAKITATHRPSHTQTPCGGPWAYFYAMGAFERAGHCTALPLGAGL